MPNAMILVDYETFYRAREANTRPWPHQHDAPDHRAYLNGLYAPDIEVLGGLSARLACGYRTILRNAYANFKMFDWINNRPFHFLSTAPGLLTEAGFAPQAVHCYKRNEHRNAADIALVVDAMETACSATPIERAVLVVGDSDYLALIRALRSRGIEVFVVGMRDCTSNLLKTAADRFFWFEELAGATHPAVAA